MTLHQDAKSLVERGDRLFSEKMPLDSRNQHIADHFYPERGGFTRALTLGEEYADHLMTGYPIFVRRSLGEMFGSMLRPQSEQWFQMSVGGEDPQKEAPSDVKAWLEWARDVQRRVMYDRFSNFTRATKETDNDYATFGGGVISVEVNWRDVSLIYRNWHLRDVAWDEDSYGQIASVHRNWEPTARELMQMFKGKCHTKVKDAFEKDPSTKIKVRHVVIRSDEYDIKVEGAPDHLKRGRKHPWKSVYVDCDNEHVMQEAGSHTRIYVLPRWNTVSGSQYGMSPATLVALPDARLVQSMALTMLNAGERAVDPPMIGVAEAIRGDLALYPGGFTAIDAQYDERLGEVLRPLSVDKSGLPFGMEMLDRHGLQIQQAFYLDKLRMPTAGEMTATEVVERVAEWRREAMPLFAPMEQDYNGALCEMTFETCLAIGAFGPMDQAPQALSGADIEFRFESPLTQMADRQKGETFLNAQAILAQAMQFDQGAAAIMDFPVALRDSLEGIGVPTKWTRPEKDVQEDEEAAQGMAETSQALEMMGQGADIANKLAPAAAAMGGAV